MLNVICLWTGNKYALEYVEKLKNMVSNNLSMEHRFICFTDKPYKYKIKGVEFKPAFVAIADSWCKLTLFHPKLKDIGVEGDALYLDLDVVVTGKLDGLVKKGLKVEEKEGKDMDGKPKTITSRFLTTINDWWREGINSSVMCWRVGEFDKIFSRFKTSDMRRLNGDQDLINEILVDSQIKHFGDIEIQSYKANHLQKGPKKETKIVVFHGEPKPHKLKDSWIQEYWK